MGLTCTPRFVRAAAHFLPFPELVLFNEGVLSETYSSNGGLLAISSGGVRDVCAQEDNGLLKHG